MYVIITWLSMGTTLLILVTGSVVGTFAIKYNNKLVIVLVSHIVIFQQYLATFKYLVKSKGKKDNLGQDLVITR